MSAIWKNGHFKDILYAFTYQDNSRFFRTNDKKSGIDMDIIPAGGNLGTNILFKLCQGQASIPHTDKIFFSSTIFQKTGSNKGN